MPASLEDKLRLARWELTNFDESPKLEVKKACLSFAIGYLMEMIEMLDKQLRAKRLNEELNKTVEKPK